MNNFCCTCTKLNSRCYTMSLTMYTSAVTDCVHLCCRAIHTRDLLRLLCTSMGMHTSLMTVNGKDLLNFSTCRPPREQVRLGTTLLRISANILYKGYQQAWYSSQIASKAEQNTASQQLVDPAGQLLSTRFANRHHYLHARQQVGIKGYSRQIDHR